MRINNGVVTGLPSPVASTEPRVCVVSVNSSITKHRLLAVCFFSKNPPSSYLPYLKREEKITDQSNF